MKKCKICKKEFAPKSNNQKYCCTECRKQAYKNYNFYSPEATERYREKVKEELGLNDTEYNFEFRERTAANKGMTTTEYNAYLEQRKADRLGLTISELRHYTYIAKRDKCALYEALGMESSEYYKRFNKS